MVYSKGTVLISAGINYFLCFLLGNSPAGNYPEESKQHSEHCKSLKSRTIFYPLNTEKFFRTLVNYYQTLTCHTPKYKHYL